MSVQFDHEKLDVYRLELRFVAWVAAVFDEAKGGGKVRLTEICDQLDRASLSVLLNTAEGNGKRQQLVRAKFFDDARGLAVECAACLDALVAKGACGADRIREGKELLIRIVSMLTRMVQMYSKEHLVRKDEVAYTIGSDLRT